MTDSVNQRKDPVLRGIIAKLSRPLSPQVMDAIGCLGFMGFGMSGFIDRAVGLEFPPIKAVSLIVGGLLCVRFVRRHRRTARPGQSDGKKS